MFISDSEIRHCCHWLRNSQECGFVMDQPRWRFRSWLWHFPWNLVLSTLNSFLHEILWILTNSVSFLKLLLDWKHTSVSESVCQYWLTDKSWEKCTYVQTLLLVYVDITLEWGRWNFCEFLPIGTWIFCEFGYILENAAWNGAFSVWNRRERASSYNPAANC